MDPAALEKTKNTIVQLLRDLEAFDRQQSSSQKSETQSDAEQDLKHDEIVRELQNKILALQQQIKQENDKAILDRTTLKDELEQLQQDRKMASSAHERTLQPIQELHDKQDTELREKRLTYDSAQESLRATDKRIHEVVQSSISRTSMQELEEKLAACKTLLEQSQKETPPLQHRVQELEKTMLELDQEIEAKDKEIAELQVVS
eukprot:m.45568 g.45568  ORF g.45568 m.45568 type:complete len:204 (+) comp15136_c0_seq1:284-895(+)